MTMIIIITVLKEGMGSDRLSMSSHLSFILPATGQLESWLVAIDLRFTCGKYSDLHSRYQLPPCLSYQVLQRS